MPLYSVVKVNCWTEHLSFYFADNHTCWMYPCTACANYSLAIIGPVWARGRYRISPPRFLAECCNRQLNQVSLVLLYFRLSVFLMCIEFVYLYFPVLFCLSVSVKWLAVKTASEMTYIMSSGALNSTPTNHSWRQSVWWWRCVHNSVSQSDDGIPCRHTA